VERLEPDVQALLVNRVGLAREYYLAPIDQCFELVGLIRANWRGFSGGQDAWRKINGFFARMKESARSLETHA
jgi:ABC-type protease/lipase transport system, ATPase and permease components